MYQLRAYFCLTLDLAYLKDQDFDSLSNSILHIRKFNTVLQELEGMLKYWFYAAASVNLDIYVCFKIAGRC
jgi:hypothetical protein